MSFTSPAQVTPTSRLDLWNLMMGFMPSRTVSTAVQLGLFGHIDAGRATVREVAEASGCSERGTRMLLEALVPLGLLGKSGDRFALSPMAAQHLVPGRPDYIGGIIEHDNLWKDWTHLAESVRTGRPTVDMTEKEQGARFFPVLVQALHVMGRDSARQAAEALAPRLLSRPQPAEGPAVLDLACGSGVWGIALAQELPTARVTYQDFPAMLDVTRSYLEPLSLLDRSDFLGGDLRAVDLGEGRFDLAILGNIVHSEGEVASRNLLRRLHRALRPGALVAIVEMVPNDERTGPPFPLLFALNMLLHTPEGDTFTVTDYSRWLRHAGFGRLQTVDIASHSPLIVAERL